MAIPSGPAPACSPSRAPVARSASSPGRSSPAPSPPPSAGPTRGDGSSSSSPCPSACSAVAALFLRDPPRGQYEQRAVLGEVLDAEEGDAPVSLSSAFARLKKVRSFYLMAVGIGVLGFALVSVPNLISLMLEDEYGYSAAARGLDAGDHVGGRHRGRAARRGVSASGASPRTRPTCSSWSAPSCSPTARAWSSPSSSTPSTGLLGFYTRGQRRAGCGVRADLAGRGGRRAAPHARPGVRARRPVRVPARRVPREPPRRFAQRRPRRTLGAPARSCRRPRSSAAPSSCTAPAS